MSERVRASRRGRRQPGGTGASRTARLASVVATGLGLGLALAGDPAPAATPGRNLIREGGFEEHTVVAVTPTNPPYDVLIGRGVTLAQGQRVPMPAGVYINPADGWPDASCRFQYVDGSPGVDVHTGRRAVRIESPAVFSAIGVGAGLSVVDGMGLEDRLLIVGRRYSFAVYAKGEGRVVVRGYVYGPGLSNLSDPARRLRVDPPALELRNDGTWERGEGVLTVTCPEVQYALFVVAVQGRVTLDDIALTEGKE